MAYSINPNLPKARAVALKSLLLDELPVGIVAIRSGVHRTTIWRWKQKWSTLNKDRQLDNPNRPTRPAGKSKLAKCRWNIATEPSKPSYHPWAVARHVIDLVLAVRAKLKRCAEVVWHHHVTVLFIGISLSSVRRILKRSHCFDGARKNRVRSDNPQRPVVTKPGELIQTDTIRHVDPKSGRRLYYYTVIDLYTRMTYVILVPKLSPGHAARAVLEAQKQWGFPIAMVQADNGPEYGHYFEQQMQRAGIQTRHSRLHRPNDNAHIERFNRTIQEECIGHYWQRSMPLGNLQEKLTAYLDYYSTRRVHLSLQLRTPSQMLQRF